MRYASLKDNIVVNVSAGDTPPAGQWVPVADGTAVEIGDAYDPQGFRFIRQAPGAPALRRITKLAFRDRFTQAEKEACDEFEEGFKGDGRLSPAQKRMVRTGLKDFAFATEINLDDPRIVQTLTLYESLGLVGADWPTRILG